jgi:hypothetical protein
MDEAALLEIYKYADQLVGCSQSIFAESQKDKPNAGEMLLSAYDIKSVIHYLIPKLEALGSQFPETT